MMEPADRASVKKQTAISIVWTVLGRGSTTATSFIVFLILARLLSASDFGIFALATVFVDLTRIVAMSGWTDAVVREEAPDDYMLDTAFWSSLGLGIVVGGATLAFALPYARLTHQPAVAELLWWLAPLVPFSCLGSIHVGRALHGFGYRALALRTFISNFVSGISAIAAALAGWGIWSLVVQALVADFINVLTAWLMYPWIPGRNFSIVHFRRLFAFTSTMMATQILWLLLARVPDIFISRSLGSSALGSFRIGVRISELVGQLFIAPVAAVATTTFARLKGDRLAVENAFVRIVSVVAVIIFPIMGGFSVLAPEAIPLIFGVKWVDSVPVAQTLMGYMVPFVLSYFDGPMFGTVGRTNSLVKLASVQLVVTALLSWLIAPYGITAVTAAYVFRSYLGLPLQQYLVWRDTGISPGRVWRSILLPLLATIFMVITTTMARLMFSQSIKNSFVLMLVLVFIGALIYVGFLLTLGYGQMISHYVFLRSIIVGKKANTSRVMQ
jgi:O-antigen/teichoic acid export membrane protein